MVESLLLYEAANIQLVLIINLALSGLECCGVAILPGLSLNARVSILMHIAALIIMGRSSRSCESMDYELNGGATVRDLKLYSTTAV